MSVGNKKSSTLAMFHLSVKLALFSGFLGQVLEMRSLIVARPLNIWSLSDFLDKLPPLLCSWFGAEEDEYYDDIHMDTSLAMLSLHSIQHLHTVISLPMPEIAADFLSWDFDNMYYSYFKFFCP